MDIEKIYQLFILGTGKLDYPLKKGLGGVIFFSKDIQTEKEFVDLIDNIKIKSKIPPLLSIDQEGGRVERTENIYPRRLSARESFLMGENYLKHQTTQLAIELAKFGINLNFSPCLDVNTNPQNPIIGDRAYSNNPEDVINCGRIVSNIYKNYNIIPCIKHYPGHGDANADSHKTLPIIDLPFKELVDVHIKPFRSLIEANAEMVMVAHLHCTAFDSVSVPTSLSKNAIKYLRHNLNYKGVIISDDMAMQGIQIPLSEACIKGIEAGLDMFIYREANDEIFEAIEYIIKHAEKHEYFYNLIEKSYNRIINLKRRYIKTL